MNVKEVSLTVQPTDTGARGFAQLSEAQWSALSFLQLHGGCVLSTQVPDKNERDVVMGSITAGKNTYKKLEKMGLVFFTQEDPMDDPGGALDGFVFTDEIYLTEEGAAALTKGEAVASNAR